MESFKQETKKEDIIDIIYFLNKDEEKKGKMKLIKKNDDNKNIITYEDIKFSFQNFLRDIIEGETSNGDNEIELFDINDLNNIIIQYIRYLYNEGWILFEENENIFLDESFKLSNLKIMINATVLPKETIKIENKIENIKKEIDKIKQNLNDIKNKDVYLQFNSIILVANPLMGKDNNEDKELRTVNDFNIIPANLYNLFKEEDYLKYTKFGILTRESFINAISDEQKEFFILHLICKSTYIINNNNNTENKNSDDYVNLIFEQKDYNCEFINKKDLDEIFSTQKIKENIKKIVLIISTPLSEDVYNIFNKYGFKNILVQHTTPANIKFVTDFNLRFYENLILKRFQNFKSIYNDALNIILDEDKNDFCCCFHKHKTGCDFFLNLKNELYNNNNEINNDLKSTIPHFCHLKPDCPDIISPKCTVYNDFCVHNRSCLSHYEFGNGYINKNHKKIQQKNIPFGYSICCCFLKEEDVKSEYNDIAHNLNNIFKTNFDNEIIKDYKAKIILEDNYIPKYEKMPFFVGKNNDIINVINALNSKDEKKNHIYIYGDTINNLKKFIENIIEYYKERYYLNNLDKKEIKKIEDIIPDDRNSENLEDTKKYYILNHEIILFSEQELKDYDINAELFKIKINPEPSKPKNEKEYNPNYYIKFQDKHPVRNVFSKKK